MGYVFVQDFKGGLDRRRMRATAPAGTLWTLENANITRGAEIEKRLALVSRFADLTGTFGMGYIAGGQITVFGSAVRPGTLSASLDYQRLEHPDGLDMSAVLCVEKYEGKFYVVAEYSDGSVFHFYDGEPVTDWYAGLVRAAMVSNDLIAEHLKSLIDAHADFAASRSGAVITVTGMIGDAFDIVGTATNGEGNAADDQAIAIATTQPAIASVSEVLARISFTITAGTSSAGTNKITSIKVNGVEILTTAVDWTTSHSGTATLLAAQINTTVSSPEYSAAASGPAVVISAAAGSGIGPNGFSVEITTAGNVKVNNLAVGTNVIGTMSGGVAAATGQAQISTITVQGSPEENDEFTVSITRGDDTVHFGRLNNPQPVARYVKAYKSKMYALSGNTLFFSGADTATGWNRSNVGAGFIILSGQSAGAEEMLAMEEYFSTVAILGRSVIQLWDLQVDPANNNYRKPLKKTGTIASKTVLAYGENDVFYLARGDIRSIRARDSSNEAFVSDVGTPVDEIAKSLVAALTEGQQAACSGHIDAVDGRYMASVGASCLVLSNFPSSKVAAWSTYTLPGQVDFWEDVEGVTHCRIADTIYAFGGEDGDEYDDDYAVTIEFPFISADDPATPKEWNGLDLALQGEWNVYIGFEVNDPDAVELVCTVSSHTFSLQKIPVNGNSPQAFLKLVHQGAGAAKVGQAILHYRSTQNEGSA